MDEDIEVENEEMEEEIQDEKEEEELHETIRFKCAGDGHGGLGAPWMRIGRSVVSGYFEFETGFVSIGVPLRILEDIRWVIPDDSKADMPHLGHLGDLNEELPRFAPIDTHGAFFAWDQIDIHEAFDSGLSGDFRRVWFYAPNFARGWIYSHLGIWFSLMGLEVTLVVQGLARTWTNPIYFGSGVSQDFGGLESKAGRFLLSIGVPLLKEALLVSYGAIELPLGGSSTVGNHSRLLHLSRGTTLYLCFLDRAEATHLTIDLDHRGSSKVSLRVDKLGMPIIELNFGDLCDQTPWEANAIESAMPSVSVLKFRSLRYLLLELDYSVVWYWLKSVFGDSVGSFMGGVLHYVVNLRGGSQVGLQIKMGELPSLCFDIDSGFSHLGRKSVGSSVERCGFLLSRWWWGLPILVSMHSEMSMGLQTIGLESSLGKYFLVDCGFANRHQFLSPFRGVRYHLQEFCGQGRDPETANELFNLRHASLRNVIERIFGIFKSRFTIFKSAPPFPYDTQAKLVLACVGLHNFLRKECHSDEFPIELDNEDLSSSSLLDNQWDNFEPIFET
ncbi:hypothetical protein FNV43_RR02384 [Rhamnella rubrinervis]|uniref:DDE Tnp4 domain-containing protein n=1 Tax=Rhamnella rubrinervis TaxID=2594499 RepID=A0A8K0HRD7_9ROSA|nr:hypothetical protein FNV43_RR02384 [Rhamnella rubrinervis]